MQRDVLDEDNLFKAVLKGRPGSFSEIGAGRVRDGLAVQNLFVVSLG